MLLIFSVFTVLEQATEKDLGSIARIIGAQDDLNLVFSELNMKNRDVKAAEKQANTADPTTKARNVLLRWRQMNGRAATRNTLLTALSKMEWTEEYEDVQKLWGL